MELNDLKNIVIGIAFLALVGASIAIANDSFSDKVLKDGTTYLVNANCGLNSTGGTGGTIAYTNCSTAYDIAIRGNEGVDGATNFMPTIGTIGGVAVLIGIVVMAFRF